MLTLNQLKSLYSNSPLWLQKLYSAIPYNIRSGAEYRKWKKFLEQELSNDEYILLKLKETVLYAYENTDYYKDIFDTLDISPHDIKTLNDFTLLPTIDKEIVKTNFNRLHAKKFPKSKTFYVSTGGSSGEPMTFLQSANVWKKELAFNMNYFTKYGYTPSSLKASLRGGTFSNTPNTYWNYNPVYNEIHFSPFHISEDTIKYYVQKLNTLQPMFFHSYPSSLLLLIEHMRNKKLTLNYSPKTIFLISENFSKQELHSIQSFFQSTVSSFYGHTERLIFAPNASADLTSYKIDSRYGFFELLNEKDFPLYTNKIAGEMVGTSFDNFAMPLLRYKTGDYTHFLDHTNNIIATVEGRWKKEYLLGKNGIKISLTALNIHSDLFKHVLQYQFHQEKPTYATLHLVVSHKFTNTDKQNILKTLEKRGGHTITFSVKIVKKLQLTPRGKAKLIINTIKA